MRFSRQGWTFFLSVGFLLLLAHMSPVSALPALQERIPCGDNPECSDEPPPAIAMPGPAPAQQQTVWGGYSDGRLNPDMAEYYSVWCLDNHIQVLRAVPSPDTSALISLADVNALNDGGSLVGANNVIVMRNGDTITISGSNGNLAPQPGSKSFSLIQCNDRNGGAPPTAQPPVVPINPPEPLPQNAEDNQAVGDNQTANDTSQCSEEWYFNAFPTKCGGAPDNGLSRAWRLLNLVCPGIVPTAVLPAIVFGSRRKRK